MKRGRLATVVLLASAAVIALVASGILDVRIQIGSRDANAIDLFGSGEEEQQEEKAKAAEPFWKESSGGAEVAPLAAEADLDRHRAGGWNLHCAVGLEPYSDQTVT